MGSFSCLKWTVSSSPTSLGAPVTGSCLPISLEPLSWGVGGTLSCHQMPKGLLDGHVTWSGCIHLVCHLHS